MSSWGQRYPMGGCSRTPHPDLRHISPEAACERPAPGGLEPSAAPAGVLSRQPDLAAAVCVERDLARSPRVDPEPVEGRHGPVDIGGGHERDHADAAVEGGLEVVLRPRSDPPYDVEDRRRRPGAAV